MTEAEIHTLSRLLMERTGLVAAGSMAVRAAIELMLQRGYIITPPKPTDHLMGGPPTSRFQSKGRRPVPHNQSCPAL